MLANCRTGLEKRTHAYELQVRCLEQQRELLGEEKTHHMRLSDFTQELTASQLQQLVLNVDGLGDEILAWPGDANEAVVSSRELFHPFHCTFAEHSRAKPHIKNEQTPVAQVQ